MKTQGLKIKSIISVALSVLALIACNKKDDNNNIANTPGNYYMNGGICYATNGQQVSTNLCTNNGYYMNGGICYNSAGQQFPITYCNNNNGANNGYYMNGGICYNSAGQQFPITSCQNNGANNGYYLSNGICYNSTGQMMPNTSYCNNIGGGMVGQQCFGSYLYQSGYWSQMVYCNGQNCRGYTLYEINSNRSVTCQ